MAGDLEILPPEVRSEIYHLLMVVPGKIHIREMTRGEMSLHNFRNDGIRARKYISSMTRRKLTSNVAIMEGESMLDYLPAAEIIFTAILRTCKKINAEAAPILYRRNYFSFNSIRPLDIFTERLNGLACSLANVEMRHLYTALDFHGLAVVQRMANPKRIKLGCGFALDGQKTATRMAREVWLAIKMTIIGDGAGHVRRKTQPPFRRTVNEGAATAWEYDAESKEAQLKLLSAFEFVVDEGVKFEGGDSEEAKVIKDPNERAKAFKELVMEHRRYHREINEKVDRVLEASLYGHSHTNGT